MHNVLVGPALVLALLLIFYVPQINEKLYSISVSLEKIANK